jgi:hypothetical protein
MQRDDFEGTLGGLKFKGYRAESNRNRRATIFQRPHGSLRISRERFATAMKPVPGQGLLLWLPHLKSSGVQQKNHAHKRLFSNAASTCLSFHSGKK